MVKISDAEYEVMKIIWKRKITTTNEIINDLNSSKWNENTIRTLVKRLQLKGAIEIVSKENKKYKYKPAIDELQYKKEVTKNFIKKFYHDSITECIIKFYENGEISLDDVKDLIKKMEEKNKKM